MKKIIHYCLYAAIALILHSQGAQAQTITGSGVFIDSVCGVEQFQVTTSSYVTGDQLKFYWGDGSSSTTSVVSTSSYQPHAYTASGTYTVKIILLNPGGLGIDSITFSNNFKFCQNMYIGGFLDVNGDGIYNGGDMPILNSATIAVDSSGVRIDTLNTLTAYDYHALGAPGTVYKFTLLSAPAGLVATWPTSGIIYDTVLTSYDSVRQKFFGFQCAAASSAFDVAVLANFSPGVTGAGSHIYITNTSCTPQAVTLTVQHSPKYAYAFAALTGAVGVVSGNTVTFNLGTVSAMSTQYFTLAFTPVGTLSLGDTVHTLFRLSPTVGDSDSTNNIVNTIDTIRTSYDPNYKSVMPAGNITPGTKLTYTLAFENTGNGTAYNIHVMDTLSDNLDANSVKIGTSTHAVNLITLHNGTQTILKFDFPNINLADSSHHDLRDGMVSFTVNAKSTLVPGNKIDNRAGIYFDNNEVVMTNTTESKIPVITAIVNVLSTKMQVYPNPVKNELTVKTDAGSFETAIISNAIGQVLITQAVSSAQTAINVSKLPAGIYYISLKGEGGVKTEKFEKL